MSIGGSGWVQIVSFEFRLFWLELISSHARFGLVQEELVRVIWVSGNRLLQVKRLSGWVRFVFKSFGLVLLGLFGSRSGPDQRTYIFDYF